MDLKIELGKHPTHLCRRQATHHPSTPGAPRSMTRWGREPDMKRDKKSAAESMSGAPGEILSSRPRRGAPAKQRQ